MTTRDALHALVDHLAEADAAELLNYAHWLRSSTDTASEQELASIRRGEEELDRGEYVTLTELARSLDE